MGVAGGPVRAVIQAVGILVLLAITLVVQGAFVGFFLYLRNRAKRMADTELDVEWSELQRASR